MFSDENHGLIGGHWMTLGSGGNASGTGCT